MGIAYKYKAPIADLNFALEVAGVNNKKYEAIPNIEVLQDQENRYVVFKSVADFAEGTLRDIYNKPEHVKYDSATHTVKLPEGYAEAYAKYAEMGIIAMTAPEKDGGLAWPKALGAAVSQIMYAGNNVFELTHSLTKSVCVGITENAKDAEIGNSDGKLPTEYRDSILRDLVSGKAIGLMVMTENKVGTHLPDMEAKAIKQEDGTYLINSTKIFITGGDNEYTTRENDKNIHHLTLVKIGDDEELSLMVISKFPIDKNGRIKSISELSKNEENHKVYVSGIEKKTGAKHSATTTMQYENAMGFLVGERGGGMKAMFPVMNEARRAIGRQALGIADIASQFSFKHAQNEDHSNGRSQGRATNGSEFPEKPADSIIVHPAVREMLLRERAFVEGARVLDFITELEADLPNKDSKKWVQLVTNMQKRHFTEEGRKATNHAVQIYGGSGYIIETGIEEFLRDAIVPEIYEGTNQVQAVTLVSRQLPNFEVFEKRVKELINEFSDKKYTKTLDKGLKKLVRLKEAIVKLVEKDINAGNAAAQSFVGLFGDVALGYVWAKTAQLAQEKLKENPNSAEKLFYETKLATANFHNNVVLREAVHGEGIIKLEQLEIPDAGIRRQDVSSSAQFAATDVTGLKFKKLDPKEVAEKIKEIAQARVNRVNQDISNATESEKRDVLKTLEQVKLDLGDGRRQDPVALQVKSIIKSPFMKKNIVSDSLLSELPQLQMVIK